MEPPAHAPAPRPRAKRNSEKRKEKSRVAARCRRSKEQCIFTDLTEALPVKKEDVEQLDKSSVMRLAISYLRVRDVVKMLPEVSPHEPHEPAAPAMKQEDVSYLQALDGFVFVISQLGDIVYCSENIADHLGVSQLDIMGQSVFEFSHPCDHEDLREVLRGKTTGPSSFLLRLKCTLTGKGRSVHLKSASYKVIHFTGHVLTPTEEMELQKAASPEQNNNDFTITYEDDDKMAVVDKMVAADKMAAGVGPKIGSLIAVGRPIPHPTNIEIPLDNKTFLTKHGLNMKFTYSDDVLERELGFEAAELAGRSLYELHHAADSAALAHHFKSLFSKGQCETGRYRFLAKTGGYAWVQTQATVITDKQQRPVSVVCVNYLISGIECKDEVFSANQMRYADVKCIPQAALIPAAVKSETKSLPAQARAPQPPIIPAASVLKPKSKEVFANGAIVGLAPTPDEARPKPATAQIFAPRTKEMNKGYLMFSEEDPGLTMLKEEPEDLTHLAPTAGDACIPLEDNPFDMFDEFILSDNYCSLLGDDLAIGSPVDSLGADSLLLSSPEPQESDSSCEQSSFLTELSLDALDGGRSEGELDGRAPYIPMSGSDELPLAPAVMWGALPDSVSLARPTPPEPAVPPPTAPALQRLLASPQHTGPPPQDIITNIYADQGLIPGGGVTTWETGVKRRIAAEEPATKRVKRSPSPVRTPATSSVLMNLLDIAQHPPSKMVNSTRAFLPLNYQFSTSSTPTLLNNKPVVRTLDMASGTNPMSPLSVNLNFNNSPFAAHMPISPDYGHDSSPIMRDYNISPSQKYFQMSPFPSPPRSNTVSPLTYNNISPGNYRSSMLSGGGVASPGGSGVLQTGRDPFLSHDAKMLSPIFSTFRVDAVPDITSLLEQGSLAEGGSGDGMTWMDTTDVLQDNGALLSGFDEVKLI